MPSTQPNNHADFHGFTSPHFTQVPDEAIDVLMPRLSGAEFKVLMYIIRRTFGFKKDADDISLKQLVDGITTRDGTTLDRGTGLSKASVAVAIKGLVEQGAITAVRNHSTEKGNEPTTYRLRFQDPLSRNQTRGGLKTGQALVQKLDTQETGLQETVEQQTEVGEYSSLSLEPDVNISKFRKGTPKNFDEEKPEPRRTNAAQSSPRGFSSLGSVLTAASHPTWGEGHAPDAQNRRTQEAERAPETGLPIPNPVAASAGQLSAISEALPAQRSGHPAAAPPASSSTGESEEERALLVAYIRDYAAEFHDQASLKSSVTRAHRLFAESGLPMERWVEKLYEAHRVTRERSAAIGYQGRGEKRSGTTADGLPNKMPYFFSTLACALGLHDHPAGQHPMPLSEQQFKRQQSKGAQVRKDSSTDQRTQAEQSNETERPSLAGKFAHLVHR